MGHYYFINQVNKKGKKITNSKGVIEWKNEIPPMFFPLFVGKAEYLDTLLYTPAKEGYELFKKMYDFLEKHKEKVFEKPDEFSIVKEKILDDVLPVNEFYQLDGTDVFAIICSEEEEFLESAQQCYALMNEVNKEIVKAIEKDDVDAFLNIYTNAKITHRSESLKYFFTYEAYKYGYEPLGYFDDPLNPKEKKEEVVIFTKNGKSGLKTKSKIILPPTYDEMWNFEENSNLAVVQNQGKFGHINYNGEVVIPLMYDDAYDFEFKKEGWNEETETKIGKYRTNAVLNKKWGVIDNNNQIILAFEWDNIMIRRWGATSQNLLIIVKRDDKFALYDFDAKNIFPLEIVDFYFEDIEANDKTIKPIFGLFWVKTATEQFYLNERYEKFAINTEINTKGQYINNPADGFDFTNYFYISKNNDKRFGLISNKNEIILPFEYENIKILNQENGLGYYLYAAWKNKTAIVFSIKYNKNGKLINEILFEGTVEKIDLFEYAHDYLVIGNKNEKGLYDIKNKKWSLPIEYEGFVSVSGFSIGTSKHILFALKEDSIEQYDFNTFTQEPVEIQYLNLIMKQGFAEKSIKEKIKKLSPNYFNKHIETIFPNADQRESARNFFPKVNFDSPQEIIAAINISDEKEDKTITLIKTIVLFDAFAFHYEKSSKEGLMRNQYGWFHYDMAQVHFALNNYADTVVWCEKAIEILPEFDDVRLEAMNLACRAAYFADNYGESIDVGKKGLDLAEQLRTKLKTGVLWGVTNTKKYQEKLADNEETLHFYLGKSYFYIADVDFNVEIYTKAKNHLEISLKMSDWRVYEKKHFYAVCIYRTSASIFDAISDLEEFISFAKDYEPDNDLFYTKFLLADSLYKKGEKLNALKIIEEVLQIDTEYTLCLELKKEINKRKGFWNNFLE